MASKQSTANSSKNPKLESVGMAMEQIEKQYGKGSIMKLGSSRKSFEMDMIPTGSIALDLALGIGGFPRGRIIEIFGPEASGKTSIALSAIAQAQARGGTAAFIDAEHALDPIWAEKLGVKLDDLLISQPDNGEQALEITETLIRSGGVDVLVVDSVAALVPKSEIEGEMGDSVMGLQARLMSQALRKLTGVISKSRTVAIFTNQLRQKIGIMFGNPETTPGGLAMKFYASMRLDMRKIETLKDGDKVIGTRHRIRVVKNKVSPPFRIAELDVMENGISKSGGLIDVGVETNVVTKSGSFYKYQEQMLGQGREAAKMELDKNTRLAKEIETEILKRARTDKLPVKLGEDEEDKNK